MKFLHELFGPKMGSVQNWTETSREDLIEVPFITRNLLNNMKEIRYKNGIERTLMGWGAESL